MGKQKKGEIYVLKIFFHLKRKYPCNPIYLSAKHFYVSDFPRARRTYVLTSTPFTPNFKMCYSYKGPGFSYATNTRCLVCTPISKMPYSRFCTLNVCVNGRRKLSICVKMALHSLINTFNWYTTMWGENFFCTH